MSEEIYIRVLQVSLGSFKVSPKDTLRLNVTTLPDHKHEEFFFSAHDIYKINHVWTIHNYHHQVKNILITLRKKSFWDLDPLVGRLEFNVEKLPMNEIKKITIDLTYREKQLVNNGQIRFEVHRCNNGAFPFESIETPVWVGD